MAEARRQQEGERETGRRTKRQSDNTETERDIYHMDEKRDSQNRRK